MHPLMQTRQNGVRIAESQATGSAPAMKLTNFALGQWALISYGNERGQEELTLVFICGDKVYVPNFPNYQQWTSSFRPLAEELSKQVRAKIEAAEVKDAAPVKDAVDIVSI